MARVDESKWDFAGNENKQLEKHREISFSNAKQNFCHAVLALLVANLGKVMALIDLWLYQNFAASFENLQLNQVCIACIAWHDIKTAPNNGL